MDDKNKKISYSEARLPRMSDEALLIKLVKIPKVLAPVAKEPSE